MLIAFIGKSPRDIELTPSMSFPQRLNHLSNALGFSMLTNAKDMASFAFLALWVLDNVLP